MTALPLRYLGWMTRDLLVGAGFRIFLVAALTIGLAIRTAAMTVNGLPLFGVHRVGTVFVLLATAGMVSRDFAGGYYRLLFTRPVSPPLYYLSRWVLGALAVLVAVLLTAGVPAVWREVPMPGADLVARAGLQYLLLGGLIFFLSTLTRHDWLVAVMLMFAQSGIGALRSMGLWSSDVWNAIYAVLPPFHLVGLQDPVAHGSELWHVALYGMGLFLAALAMLQWRSLGSGSRTERELTAWRSRPGRGREAGASRPP